MALTSAKYEAIHNRTGGDLDTIKNHFDNKDHTLLANFPGEAALIYQMQKMQDELDYLRTEISANKDKISFPGLGTSGSVALAGDTKLLAIGSDTTLSFGDMISTTVRGRTSYTIVLTVTNRGVVKSTTLTLT